MSKQLEQSRANSMQAMAEINKEYAIKKFAYRYEVIDQGELNAISPALKGKIEFENKKAAGFFDELNFPIKKPYIPDLEIFRIQKEIERLTA